VAVSFRSHPVCLKGTMQRCGVLSGSSTWSMIGPGQLQVAVGCDNLRECDESSRLGQYGRLRLLDEAPCEHLIRRSGSRLNVFPRFRPGRLSAIAPLLAAYTCFCHRSRHDLKTIFRGEISNFLMYYTGSFSTLLALVPFQVKSCSISTIDSGFG
jgi:hypothetical protein